MKKQFIFSLIAAAITLGAVSSVKPVDITAAPFNGIKSDDSITMSKEYGRKHPTTEVLLPTDLDDNYLEISKCCCIAENSLFYFEGLKELEKKCSTTPQRKIELESEKIISLKPIEQNNFIVNNGNLKNNLKK